MRSLREEERPEVEGETFSSPTKGAGSFNLRTMTNLRNTRKNESSEIVNREIPSVCRPVNCVLLKSFYSYIPRKR